VAHLWVEICVIKARSVDKDYRKEVVRKETSTSSRVESWRQRIELLLFQFSLQLKNTNVFIGLSVPPGRRTYQEAKQNVTI
jgi:hypothetical protein